MTYGACPDTGCRGPGAESTDMRIAVVGAQGRGWWLPVSAEDGAGHGPIVFHNDFPVAVAERERAGDVRWIWAAGADSYPALLRAGVRVQRCHDVALTEALLLARDGRLAALSSSPIAPLWAPLPPCDPPPASPSPFTTAARDGIDLWGTP